MANTQTGLNKRLLLERAWAGSMFCAIGILIGTNFANMAFSSKRYWLGFVPLGLAGACLVLAVFILLKLRPVWRADQEKPADG